MNKVISGSILYFSGECDNEDTDLLCPQYHWLVPIMLGVYLLIGNVLLLNLLIAIFR